MIFCYTTASNKLIKSTFQTTSMHLHNTRPILPSLAHQALQALLVLRARK